MTTTAAAELVEQVARAVAEALPSTTPLTTAPSQPGSPHVTTAFAGAVQAPLEGVPGPLVLCVGSELVDALAAAPMGGLDVAAAVQPAIDAAAAGFGARAGTATRLDLDAPDFDVVRVLGGEFLTVPLIGTGIAAALLVPTATAASARPAASTATVAHTDTDTDTDTATATSAGPAGAAEPFVPAFGAPGPQLAPMSRGLEMLHGVDMEVTVELGRTRMTVRDLLALSPGAVLELDRAAGSPADLLVNGRLVARGEVVVVDEDFGLRVTEIVDAGAVV